jgi:hypothetical protein
MSYSNSSFQPVDKANKLGAGIFTGLTFTETEETDKYFKFTFIADNGDYADLCVFPTVDAEKIKEFTAEDFKKKGKVASGEEFKKACALAYTKAETTNLTKLNELAIALGSAEDVVKLEGKNYSDLCNKIVAYINKNKNNKINVKLTAQYSNRQYAEINVRRLGNIEAYVPGALPKLKFTTYELDNNYDKTTHTLTGNSSSYVTTSTVANPFGPATTTEAPSFSTGASDMVSSNPFMSEGDDKDLPF